MYMVLLKGCNRPIQPMIQGKSYLEKLKGEAIKLLPLINYEFETVTLPTPVTPAWLSPVKNISDGRPTNLADVCT